LYRLSRPGSRANAGLRLVGPSAGHFP
jgi:hypothetical protein